MIKGKKFMLKLITALALAVNCTAIIELVHKDTAIQTVAAAQKLSKKERAAKNWIARHESGGNYNARNGVCYGKYQLNLAYLGGNYSPKNQERIADNYVYNRYGSWVNAKRFWLIHHWY
ncbi:hypothetical protein SAMN04487792_1490 [Lactobacillus bombicola]|uniref:Aggregation promoting factor surface protein n=2 Tax=Lactobacillaceae TaxID=33958 RepID=A0A1I1TKR6_9LACO|nr:hypothetical protein SAMN04487792_1490 [Lactobacillus bombicola]